MHVYLSSSFFYKSEVMQLYVSDSTTHQQMYLIILTWILQDYCLKNTKKGIKMLLGKTLPRV